VFPQLEVNLSASIGPPHPTAPFKSSYRKCHGPTALLLPAISRRGTPDTTLTTSEDLFPRPQFDGSDQG